MKLFKDVVAGVAAAGVAYWVASAVLARTPPSRVAEGRSSTIQERADTATDSPPRRADSAAARIAAEARAVQPAQPSTEPADDLRTIQQRSSMTLLRNEVIRASAEDMARRRVSVTSCLDGTRLSGEEKIRFAVDVESTADHATIGAWRFVEIADGEPLPGSFATCAERAFGRGHRVAPPPGEQFPEHRGELMMLYTIPAPDPAE